MRNKPIGGVTPLKRRTSRTRAGTVGQKATATRTQDKSGYSRSGAEGVNTPSFTTNTRFKSSLVDELDIEQPSKEGKSNKSGATVIGTDASGAPIYNYYGDTHIDQSVSYEDSFNQTANVNTNQNTSSSSKKKKKSHGNFREACYNSDGSRKPVGSIGTDSDGNRFLCKWGGGGGGGGGGGNGGDNKSKVVIKFGDNKPIHKPRNK